MGSPFNFPSPGPLSYSAPVVPRRLGQGGAGALTTLFLIGIALAFLSAYWWLVVPVLIASVAVWVATRISAHRKPRTGHNRS